jgi:hypothetical protein
MLRRVALALSLAACSAFMLSSCAITKDNLKISGAFAPTGTVGTAYSATLTASGGDGGDLWTVTGLPTGIAVPVTSGSTLAASGTPTTPGTYEISATVTDAHGDSKTYSGTLVISSQPLSISPVSLGALTSTEAVSGLTLTATPATTGPYTWTVSSGTLPAGLVLNNGSSTSATAIESATNSITISGTVVNSGLYSFTLSVADAITPVADAGSQSFSGLIHAGTVACAPAPMPRGNESALTSPYAFVVQGTDTNQLPIAYAGSVTPDGKGGISVAAVDFVGSAAGAQSLSIDRAESSYSYGSDGRGCLFLVFGAATPGAERARRGSVISAVAHSARSAHQEIDTQFTSTAAPEFVTFSFALNSSGSGRITEFDSADGAGPIAAGMIHAQTAADFSVASLAPNYVFGMDGWYTLTSTMIDRAALAGSFTNTSGTVSSGFSDVNLAGNYLGEQVNGTGTLGSVSPATGRGLGTYNVNVGGTDLGFDYAFYIINASDYYIISTENPSTVGAFLVTGRALAASAVASAPDAYFLAAWTGIDLTAGPSGRGANYAAIATIQTTSDGAIPAATIYANDAGNFTSSQASGEFTVAPLSSRVTMTGFPDPPVAYLAAPNQDDGVAGFLAGTDAFTSSGIIVLQSSSAPSYTAASLNGNFVIGSSEDPTGASGSIAGAGEFNGAGNYSDVRDVVATGQPLAPGASVSTSYSMNSDGSGTLAGGNVAFVTSGTVVFAIDSGGSSTEPLLYILLQ